MNYAAKSLRLFCVIALLTLPLIAQIQFGQITGDITDPAGATVPNARVTVRNLSTGLAVNAATNSSGHFVAGQLPPGQYTVSVTAQGFKTSTQNAVVVNAGSVSHMDVKLSVGQVTETVEVTSATPQVDVETSRLAQIVTSEQVASLPLNGRNVYDLIQMVPGAVNVTGVDFEGGHNTVVNGLRENFNGFLLNGVPNKGLSGGVNNTPIQDTVQEFQQLTLNMSAQYGNSAGSITNLVTKSGTNAWHGSAWEFFRNDVLDANSFFLNRQADTLKHPTCSDVGPGCPAFKPALRFNQFGGTVGGAIKKDKLFFFLSYQGDRFKTIAPPQTITVESPEFRQAVINAFPNSTAALMYKNFSPTFAGSNPVTLGQYVASAPSGFTAISQYTNPQTFLDLGASGAQANLLASRFSTLFGALSLNTPFELQSVAVFPSQTQSLGNLFNGNEASGRIDFNLSDKNRFFAQYNWLRSSDTFGPCNAACTRGFTNPTRGIFPNGQLSWVHTFSPKLINELRLGYTQNNTVINAGLPGVPQVGFDDGTAGFGSYSGYPQFFKEHVYTYSDLVSLNKGSHNMKIGVDVKRNLENSEFNVARPSYYFFDPLFFAVDAPYTVSAGVDPGFISGNPAQLASNVRHWRNVEVGGYFQDDWKTTRKLTLNLGLRYDLFTRHSELNNQATTFILGPGNNFVDSVKTGAGQLRSANADCPALNGVLAGVCGPGGFAKASSLGLGDHNNFGPRVGFAYDVFGNGKMSVRGGFGVSYESTLYNPLSNSRWNPPFYSFDSATNFLAGDVGTVVFGPSVCNTTGCAPSGAPPTFTGAPSNPGQGVGAQAVGNLSGWFPNNPHTANLTGIVFPKGIRDPYVYNFFLSTQQEILPKLVLELDYVGTAGHKLFRAEDINRKPGARLPGTSACVVDNFGRDLCGTGEANGRVNGNYGRLRVWENSVNSNYNSMQVAVKKQTSHGINFNFNYTWSHTIDEGSTWHSGATTANGAAAGEGFTTDVTLPGLDRGNAIFDIRHRIVANYVWDLPTGHFTGALGQVLGGWQLNGIWVLQTGPHWEPFDSRGRNLKSTVRFDPDGNPLSCNAGDVNNGTCVNVGGDFNLDRVANDRPNSSVPGFGGATHDMWANGWGNAVTFSTPCLGCTGNLGRNTFVGPTDWYADMSLFKNIKIRERATLQFRAEAFNIFNHTNFLLAASAAGTSAAHNRINGSNFGQAGATLNPRNLQLGLKVNF